MYITDLDFLATQERYEDLLREAKQEMLGVRTGILETHGAVSEATVGAMVRGALEHSPADIAVAISGIAGPGGGSESKPVGTVCFGWMIRGGEQVVVETTQFHGSRDEVRSQAVEYGLDGLIGVLS